MHTKCPFYHISVNMTGECKRDEERKGRAEEAQGVSHDSTLQSDEESHTTAVIDNQSITQGKVK